MRSFVMLSALLAAVGCGSDDPFSYVDVSGRVVFEDGEPLTTGQVVFSPQLEPVDGLHPKSSVAYLDSNGEFKGATTTKPGDGVIQGEHKISFVFVTDEQGNLLVPRDYTISIKTPLAVHTDESPFTFTVPRP